MSVTVSDYINNLESAINGLNKATYDSVAVQSTQDTLADMTLTRLDSGYGSDGNVLNNSNPIFSGRYSLLTEMISQEEPRPLLPKVAGDLYNFVWNGDFAKSFSFNVEYQGYETPKLITKNTGTGSDNKADFFDGYGNQLFGFYGEQLDEVNRIIYNHICKYLKEKL